MVTPRLTPQQALKLAPVTRMARKLRSPEHTFNIRQRPFAITPFFIAPVLPGETLEYLLMQSRTITEGVTTPLGGMWLEHYFFYVKHRDLVDISDDLVNMVLDPTDPFATLAAADVADTYTAKGCVDWVHYCLKRVTETYFRDEGEAWDTWKIGSYLPAAKVNETRWFQSIADTADVTAEDIDLDLPVDVTPDPDQVHVSAQDLTELMRQYQLLKDMNYVEMSYEDWLMTYGVTTPKAEQHIPELVRYFRDWQTPSNGVSAEGTPRYVISWTTAERANKKRRFKEPGFLFGVSVLRPKIYFAAQHGSAVGLMSTAQTWLPAMTADDPGASLIDVSHTDLLIPDFTENFTIDIKDLLIHGDQFINYAMASVPTRVDLPVSTTNYRYPDSDDADRVFTTPATNNYATTDGIVRMSVAGHQTDTTPRTVKDVV